MFCLWGRDWGAEEGLEQRILRVRCFVPFTVQWMEEWIKPSLSNQPWPLLDPSQWNQTPAAGNEERFCVSSFSSMSFFGLRCNGISMLGSICVIFFRVNGLKTVHILRPPKLVLGKGPKVSCFIQWLGLVDFIREQLQWIRSANATALRRMFISEQPDCGTRSSAAGPPQCFF